MAYFKHNEPEETRRNVPVVPEQEFDPDDEPEFDQDYDEYINEYDNNDYYDDYDDGFDEPDDDEQFEEELTEEEMKARKKDRIQLLFGAGDLTGIIVGTVVILLLTAFLVQMITFVRDDIKDFLDAFGRFF